MVCRPRRCVTREQCMCQRRTAWNHGGTCVSCDNLAAPPARRLQIWHMGGAGPSAAMWYSGSACQRTLAARATEPSGIMSKRISNDSSAAGNPLSAAEARTLLEVLCVKYGFCLSPLWRSRLERNPPRSIDKFTDTVFHAEGLDPRAADTDLYKSIRDEVRGAFERSAGGTGP